MKAINLNIRLTPLEKKLLQTISKIEKVSMSAVVVDLIYKEFRDKPQYYNECFVKGGETDETDQTI